MKKTSPLNLLLTQDSFWVINKHLAKVLKSNDAALLVSHLVQIQENLFNGQEFFQQRERIVEECNITIHTFNQVIKQLIDLEILDVEKKGIPAKNFYFLHLDKLSDLLSTNLLVENNQLVDTNSTNWLTQNQPTGGYDFNQLRKELNKKELKRKELNKKGESQKHENSFLTNAFDVLDDILDIREKKKEKSSAKKERKILPEAADCYVECVKHFPEHLWPGNQAKKDEWLFTIDKLLRIDKIPKEKIVQIVKWARENEFWSKNFLSLTKLRKKNTDGVSYVVVFSEQMKPAKNNKIAEAAIKNSQGW